MRIELEPIPYGPNQSFASILFSGKTIVCPYHRHPELELVAIDSSRGRVVIGNYSGTFCEGNIFLIGENVPHIFQRSRIDPRQLVQTHVIQFRRDFAGPALFEIPELVGIKRLLSQSGRGLKILGPAREEVRSLMMAVHQATGAWRILRLIELLNKIAQPRSVRPLQSEASAQAAWSEGRMGKIVAYIQENLTQRILVPEAAQRAGLTPNAFCRYFKLHTRRTFTDFVNELRITEACRLLRETDGSVTEICYASGFSSPAHFHEEFKARMRATPVDFRKKLRIP